MSDKNLHEGSIRGQSEDRLQENLRRFATVEMLAASELRYRRLFETAKDGILILDAETGMIVDVNPFLVKLLGFSHEIFLGKKLWELGFFKDIVASQASFAELQQKEYIRYENKPLETSDGRRIEVEFISNVYLANHHKVIQCNIRDITERKKVERRQSLSVELPGIVNKHLALPDMIKDIASAIKRGTGFDAVGIRLRDGEDFKYIAQQGFSEDFLLTENTLIERAADGGVCWDKDGKIRLECTCGLVISGKIDTSNPLVTSAGSFWTNNSSLLLDLPGGQDPRLNPRNRCIHDGYGSVALIPIRANQDIIGILQLNNRRKDSLTLDMIHFLEGISASIGVALIHRHAEEELKKSKALINAVVENVPLMIFLKEATELRFVIFNRAGEELLGYDRKALIGKNNLDLFPPEQAAHFMTSDREVLDGETGILDIPEEPILTAKKGQRLLHTRKICIRGEDGATKYLLGISEDITERKLAETEHEKLESQLRQSQKMESIGQLAGGIAHDFNNMLSVINGYSKMILDELPKSDLNYYRIQEINKAGNRSADLTRQLLAFARKQVISPKVLDLNDNIDGILKMLRRILGEDIELSWKPAARLWKIKMDSSQIDQLLANLPVNASDAISGVGKVVIETGKADLDEAYCSMHQDFIPGKYVVLSISDNGCGMDKEIQDHMFEPFFTTKKVGEGTGLGLATVFGIVKQNKGNISFYSEPGKGTTFQVYLPKHESEDVESHEKSEPVEIFRGSGTVLLVEDEQSLLLIAKILIERLGYTVLSTSSPLEAINIAQEYKGDIHLLMTDVIMPEISGSDLQKQISVLRPDIKCLFMSGYTADVISHDGVLIEGIHFLQKPFTEQELSLKLHEALCPHKQ